MGAGDGAAVTSHRELVRELSRPGGPLSVGAPTSSVRNRAWFRATGGLSFAREQLHRRLLDEHAQRYAGALSDRQAIVLAGPPGAGKSSVLRNTLGEGASEWMVVDADEFKHGLLRTAIEDGTYDSWLVPEPVRDLIAAGERFAPLELASLVHEESSMLAAAARSAAMADGKNIVVDTVLSSPDSASRLGAQLEQAGYRVRVVDVECSYEVSAARIEYRWREVTRQFLSSEEDPGLGGRWVPSEYARPLFPAELDGRSVCEGIARDLAERCPVVWRHELHRVTDPAGAPQLMLARERVPWPGGVLVDADVARAAGPSLVQRGPRHVERPGFER